MLQYIFLAFGLQLSVAFVGAQDCSCRSFVPKRFQPRGVEKLAKGDKHPITKPEIIDVDYIYCWQTKYKATTDKLAWNDFKRRSKRRRNTPEDTIYSLRGYLWFVKKESFDCDYHIEIGPKDSGATRIVVEIPHMYVQLQKKVQLELLKRHLPLLYCTTKNVREAHFKKGIPVMIKGYGFYDAYHKPDTNHGDYHTKKYTWELHPVIDFQFLNEE